MIELKDTLQYFHIFQNKKTREFWKLAYNESAPGGRFMLDFAQIEPNVWISRNGAEWSLPWPVKIKDRFKMPIYEPAFKKSWQQITDERAADVARIIREENKKFSILYSGGIDSTLITVALLKNLSKEELKNINFYCNTASIIENPIFYKKYIHERFKTIDSAEYLIEDVIAQGYTVISSMSGDCLCGSKNWLDLQANLYYYMRDLSTESKKNISNNWRKATDPSVHYSIFKDLIISHYNRDGNNTLGEQYYAKIEKNIKTSNIPVHSLYDLYWWNIFNIKYIHLSAKLYIIDNFKMSFDNIEKNMFDWYNNDDYQKWSMVNNYTGEKIDFSGATIKLCVKKYIHEFDKNDWYFHFKQKLPSNENQKMRNISQWGNITPMTLFGLTQQSERLYLEDKNVQDYILHHLSSFEKDW
jgi:hypothetical protein